MYTSMHIQYVWWEHLELSVSTRSCLSFTLNCVIHTVKTRYKEKVDMVTRANTGLNFLYKTLQT